jgi:transcriptional regulator with XRE-family HTH domain
MTNLGKMIRAYRAVNDLDLRTFGHFIGLSAPTIMRIEQGRSFDAATWMKIQEFMLRECS